MASTVTEVTITPFNGEGPAKAFARVIINGDHALGDIRVMSGKDGLWVAMPRRQGQTEGEWFNIHHPITTEWSAKLRQAVLDAYQEKVGGKAPAADRQQSAAGRNEQDRRSSAGGERPGFRRERREPQGAASAPSAPARPPGGRDSSWNDDDVPF